MSEWRDIWKDSVSANKKMYLNPEEGLKKFDELHEKYKKNHKDNPDWDDGMLHYAKAEAYELLKNWDGAKKEYERAKELFPVKHWKEVAQKSVERVNLRESSEASFNIRNLRKPYTEKDFKNYLWYGFQKTYEYIKLDDFSRYISLSALSRGSSEWALSLVDFRSVMEWQINKTFEDIVKDLYEYKKSHVTGTGKRVEVHLNEIIDELFSRNVIDESKKNALHQIRIEGNLATHSIYEKEEEINSAETYEKHIGTIDNYLTVLRFFNEYQIT